MTGVIDFSDIMDSRIVFEVATFLTYVMVKAFYDNHDPLSVAAKAGEGFESVLPLTSEEKTVLYICILKRMAVSVCSRSLEKSLGASGEKLKDLPAMSSLAKMLWFKGEEQISDELSLK